jgi:hypothetical protein
MAQGSDVASTITRLMLEGKTNTVDFDGETIPTKVRIGSNIATETDSENSYCHVSKIYHCSLNSRISMQLRRGSSKTVILISPHLSEL